MTEDQKMVLDALETAKLLGLVSVLVLGRFANGEIYIGGTENIPLELARDMFAEAAKRIELVLVPTSEAIN